MDAYHGYYVRFCLQATPLAEIALSRPPENVDYLDGCLGHQRHRCSFRAVDSRRWHRLSEWKTCQTNVPSLPFLPRRFPLVLFSAQQGHRTHEETRGPCDRRRTQTYPALEPFCLAIAIDRGRLHRTFNNNHTCAQARRLCSERVLVRSRTQVSRLYVPSRTLDASILPAPRRRRSARHISRPVKH